jgi:serine protease Do
MFDHFRRLLLALAVFFLSALLFTFIRSRMEGYGFLDLWSGRGPASEGFTQPVAPRLQSGDVELLQQLDAEYSKLADAVLPAVVSIDTQVVRRKTIPLPMINAQAFQDYLAPGSGSGAIISREGHVVTNFHVIEGASQVTVKLSTNETLPARVLDGSRELDIALLKIDSKHSNFPALTFADSNKVKTGQIVFAVGNPFGLNGTITQGIISARSRQFSDNSLNYLQTDTAINRGSSGGPLVNVSGEIVGINVAFYKGDSNSDAWQGVGLAVPANEAKLVIDSVLSSPAGKRSQPSHQGYLGVALTGYPVRVPDGESAGTIGVQVEFVPAGSPAAQADLRPGDIVTAFNGIPTRSPEELLTRIKLSEAGSKVRLTVWRQGELGNLDAELVAAKDQRGQ